MCGDCKQEHGTGASCGSSGGGSGEKTCGSCSTSMGGGHFWRCSKHWCAKLLWFAGVIALIAAWVADSRGVRVWGFTADHLFHDAIAFLVLAVSLKLFKKKRCGSGGKCC